MPIEWFLIFLASAIAAGAVIALLHWDDIRSWLYRNRANYDDYGELIKKSLADGNVRVVAGVFSKYGTQRAVETWDSENLDYELDRRFSVSNRIRINL